MYILSVNMWFQTLIRQFFFNVDRIVFNFISIIYDLLISIARTSVLSQGDILELADRIYKLLAIFMIFKVTFSLIMYVVNPDDFSDKSKGISKLGVNIIISLLLLILTPYIFSYAYQLQTIILEDNSLATLLFGKQLAEKDFFRDAGDDMAFLTLQPFFLPNVSLDSFSECVDLDDACFKQLREKTEDDSKFTPVMVENYKIGIDKHVMGMSFRQDLAVATIKENDEEVFVMDYKFIFSTVIGVVVVLLLITFCMDVGLRSIKLAFLQLIAPIPIISYVDPKSGKDGLFKKWYQLCFKTFLSLFIRLLALYFAVYIISKVADGKLIDVVDGSYQTNLFVAIFIIIGALMFAKQLPKILEGLGIKLDSDGKFFLNPLKKFEEQAAGGKRITGAVGGAAAGLIGGHGVMGRLGSAFTGGIRGAAANKGYRGGMERQSEVNRKLREARINGAGFLGSRAAVLSSRYGLDDYGLEKDATNLRKDKRVVELARRGVDERTKAKETEKKTIQDSIAPDKKKIEKQTKVQEAISKMEERAKAEVTLGHGGDIGQKYTLSKLTFEDMQKNGVAQIALKKENKEDGTISYRVATAKEIESGEDIVRRDATDAEIRAGVGIRYRKASVQELQEAENKMNNEFEAATYKYISAVVNGGANNGTFSDGKTDATLQTAYTTYLKAVEEAQSAGASIENRDNPSYRGEIEVITDGESLHKQLGTLKGSISHIQNTRVTEAEGKIKDIDDEIRDIQVNAQVRISGIDEEIKLENAENEINKREKLLKDKQDQRKLDRETAKNKRLGGS